MKFFFEIGVGKLVKRSVEAKSWKMLIEPSFLLCFIKHFFRRVE